MYILRGWRQSDVGADGVGADGIGADESTYVSISQEDLVLMQVVYSTVRRTLQEHSKCSAITWFATTSCAEVEYYFLIINVYFLTVVFCGTLLQNIPIQNEYIYKSSFILSYFYVLLTVHTTLKGSVLVLSLPVYYIKKRRCILSLATEFTRTVVLITYHTQRTTCQYRGVCKAWYVRGAVLIQF